MSLIRDRFPDLPEPMLVQLDRLPVVMRTWNERLNLVSSADAERLEERHLLPCLALLRLFRFPGRARVLDLGTGGGLPGLPLAITHPSAQFFLLDSVGKKVRAVAAMAEELGLANVAAVHKRVEDVTSTFDWITGRAVTALPRFLSWAAPKLRDGGEGLFARGVFYFKGTLWQEELAPIGIAPTAVHSLSTLLGDEAYADRFLLFFDTKTARAIAAKANAIERAKSPSKR